MKVHAVFFASALSKRAIIVAGERGKLGKLQPHLASGLRAEHALDTALWETFTTTIGLERQRRLRPSALGDLLHHHIG
jgi:hypothetical protein